MGRRRRFPALQQRIRSMYGGGTGEVCGEVMKEHLTIGKADKQGDSELFGEVLSFFSMKIMEVVLTIEIVFAGF